MYWKLTYIPFGDQAKDLLKKIDSISTRCQIFVFNLDYKLANFWC